MSQSMRRIRDFLYIWWPFLLFFVWFVVDEFIHPRWIAKVLNCLLLVAMAVSLMRFAVKCARYSKERKAIIKRMRTYQG